MDRSINFSKPSYDRNKSRRGLATSFLLIIFFYVAILISLPARAVPPPSSPPVVIDFENLTTGGPGGAGTLVAVFRQFVDPSASRGVIFNGPKAIDYSLGPFAIPDFAHSGSRAIEACVGQEFCTLPIEMTFTAAQTRVKVMAGYSAPLTQASAVVLRAFDSAGTMVGTASATLNASTSPQSIQLPLEVSTPNPSIVRVTVSLSAGTPTLNNHLAIDDVEFDIPGPPPPCVAAQAPILSLTSPVAGETEYSNEFLFQGAVNTADQLTLATLNVQQFGPAPPTFLDLLSSGVVSSNGGNFAERLDGLLVPGNNIVSFQAQNCRGLADGIDLQVFYFVPSPPRVLGAEINQGLPTYPLVAGKSTLARVYVSASDPLGATVIDRALLDVTSTSTGRTFTVSANIPNPHFTGMGQKYGTNDNINFIVPGSLLPAGSYSFRARLFNGPEVISTVNFGGNTYSFTRTQDVRILVVLPDYLAYERTPDELGLLFDYLDDVARALPIRNGWGIPGDDAGLQVTLRPFEPVCDGTFPSPFPNCGPSQTEVDSDVSARFKWRLVQDRASGQLRTQMPSFVTDSVPCPGRNTLSYLDDGSGNLRTVLVPGTFLYFPGFLPNTADPTFDLNYDGRLDATDLAPYVAEYFNGRTGAWSQDLSQLRPGDIVHNFVDSNTDPTLNRNCVFNTGEQQAPFTEGMLVSWMIQKARVLADAANVRFGAYAIWPGMDQAGTAGGTSYGDTFWAVLKPWPTFHHELGHGFGLVSSQAPNFDGCCHSRNFNVNDPRGFNVIRGISLGSANSIMSGQGISPPYYGSMFEAVDYTSIFNQLRESPLSSGRTTGETLASQTQFLLNAYVDKQDHFQPIESSLIGGLESTSMRKDSPYSLFFLGANKKVLTREPVPVTFESPSEHIHVHGGNYHSNAFVHFVRPLPKGTTAVEFRRDGHLLTHIDRQTAGPSVKIRSVRTEVQVYEGHTSDMLILSWDASHPRGARLTYSVSYSADGGKTWMAIGSGLLSTQLAWNLRAAAGSKEALVKVTASDGFNRSSDTSSPFFVDAKQPLVALLPDSTEERLDDRPVTLRGDAFDLQDGLLSGKSLQWSSNVSGKLGRGKAIERTLPAGQHLITLSATNSWGKTATAQATITVTRSKGSR